MDLSRFSWGSFSGSDLGDENLVMYSKSSRCSKKQLSIKVKVLEGLNLDIPASASAAGFCWDGNLLVTSKRWKFKGH